MRTSTHGLAIDTPIRVANAPARRHARGRIVRLFSAPLVEYRSDYDGSLRVAQLADVHIRRPKARKAVL